MWSTDLHDDIAVNIKNHVNEKVNGNTLFALPEISIDFVLKQLRSMPNDGIGASTLELAYPAIADSITYICNLSIITKSFPEKWKEAKVTPIFKKGKTDDCSNYYSFADSLNFFLQKHVYICLYSFLQDKKLLLDTPFGFRKNHSCQTALITPTEEIYNAIQTGNLFGLLQSDLSKAFDLVILKTGHNKYLLRAHYHNHRQSTPAYHKGRF